MFKNKTHKYLRRGVYTQMNVCKIAGLSISEWLIVKSTEILPFKKQCWMLILMVISLSFSRYGLTETSHSTTVEKSAARTYVPALPLLATQQWRHVPRATGHRVASPDWSRPRTAGHGYDHKAIVWIGDAMKAKLVFDILTVNDFCLFLA